MRGKFEGFVVLKLSKLFHVTAIASLSWMPTQGKADDRLPQARPWELLGVWTAEKMRLTNNRLLLGVLMIRVEGDRPIDALGTADWIAKRLINSGTLGAVQVFAYTRDYPNTKRNAALVQYSTNPDFMKGSKWFYELAREQGSLPQPIELPEFSAQLERILRDPIKELHSVCPNIIRCDVGKTSL